MKPPSPPAPVDSTVKLVATDLDGTIVRWDGMISQRTVNVLHSLESAGVMIVFVTGRPPRWMGPVVKDTGMKGLCICSNGAHLYDSRTREIVEERSLDPDLAGELAADIGFHFPGASFAVEIGHNFGHEPAFSPGWDPPAGSIVGPIEQLVTEPVAKLLARCPEPRPDVLLDEARALVGERATVTRSIGVGLVEISRRGVDKGSALARLASSHGIDASEVIAFGDESNDAPMLAWAGRAVAVANAHANALNAATEVTASVDDDGVAKVLEQLFG